MGETSLAGGAIAQPFYRGLGRSLGAGVICVLSLWLSGCVGKYHVKYRESTPPQVAYDYQTTVVKPASYRISDWALSEHDDPALTVSVEQLFSAQKFSYQEQITEKGGRKDADMICFIFPFFWFLLVVEPENCFARTDEWQVTKKQRINLENVGKPEPKWVANETQQLTLELTGLDESARQQEQLRYRVSQNHIGLRRHLATLQVEPNSVAVRVSAQGESADAIQFEIDRQALAVLVPRPVWLPMPMAKDKFMLGLRDALIAGDVSKANGYFEKLVNMPIELPDSFYYRYAVSLSKVGRHDEARKYARRYLALAGEGGAHAQQAKGLLR